MHIIGIMCGRFGFTGGIEKLTENFNLEQRPLLDIKPRYNIAPSQRIIGITHNSPLKAIQMYWGFIPSWADPSKTKLKPINAREDKIDGGFYRTDFKNHRCLIPASFFFEWKKVTVDGEDVKHPYFIKPKGKDIFAFAGLYSIHKDAEGLEILTGAIITTKPNKEMKKIHDRMPVILHKEDYSTYLDDSDKAKKLLVPYTGSLEMYRVSTKVNSAQNDSEELTEAL